MFRDRLKAGLKTQRGALKTTAGQLGTAIDVVTAIPGSVSKVRNAPRRHRGWIVFREIFRAAGRVALGPAWQAVEVVGAGARRLNHNIKAKK